MDLHYGHVSGNSARAVFALFESGADCNLKLVDTQAAANRETGYLSINPMGKIPALTDGKLRLWESNAINWYLAEKHPASRLLPESLEGRARVQRWLFFQAAHVSPACLPIFRASNPRTIAFWKTVADPVAVEGGKKELSRYLPVLESNLGDCPYLEGEFSLADIAYTPHLWMIREGGYSFSRHPVLAAWLERLLARPAWKKTEQLVFGS
jgi:glutathione S-transferase